MYEMSSGENIHVNKMSFSVMLLVFLLSALVVPVTCQEVTVGVAEGDWFTYLCDLEIEGNLSLLVTEYDLNLYADLQSWNETEWERREVMAVSGTLITFNVTTHYVNGSETAETVDFNMTSSDDFWVIGANLEVGEQVGVMGIGTLYIEETNMWQCDGETREVNEVDWYPAQDDFVHKRWWDKQTGVLVKYEFEFWQIHLDIPNYYISLRGLYILSDTNLWVVGSEFPSATAMALVFVAVIVCVDVYRRRKLLK
jgi:hypothetical protein